MANPTTNYAWQMPTPTDLVTDLPADFEVFGQAVDSTVFANAAAGLSATIVDAKGDIIAATAADAVSRLAVGANDTILTADSTAATGIKWAAAPSVGDVWSELGSVATTGGASTITISGISGKEKLFIILEAVSVSGTNANIGIRINGETSGYILAGSAIKGLASWTSQGVTTIYGSQPYILLATTTSAASASIAAQCLITGCNSATSLKMFQGSGSGRPNGSNNDHIAYAIGGYKTLAATVTSISVNTTSAFNGGTLIVYANS